MIRYSKLKIFIREVNFRYSQIHTSSICNNALYGLTLTVVTSWLQEGFFIEYSKGNTKQTHLQLKYFFAIIFKETLFTSFIKKK